MNNQRWATLLATLLALTACADTPLPEEPDDPGIVGVCDHVGACEVNGVDLVIDEFSLALPASHPKDAATGLPWVQTFDSVPVRYRIRNRGNAPSAATTGLLSSCAGCGDGSFFDLPIRALEPGSVDSGIVKILATSTAIISTPMLDLDIPRGVDDPFYRNNRHLASNSFISVVPNLQGTVEVLSPEVRVGAPLRVAITVRNDASRGIQRDTSVSLCLRGLRSDGSLDGCDFPFGSQSMPTLNPGAQWSDTVDVVLAHTNYQGVKHAALPFRLDVCMGNVLLETGSCAGGTQVLLRPNLETVCAIRRLTPGVALRDTFPGVPPSLPAPCYTYLGRYQAYSFEGSASVTYNVQLQTAGIATQVSIWTPGGVQVGTGGAGAAQVTVPTSGRYYVVVQGTDSNHSEFTVLLTPSGG